MVTIVDKAAQILRWVNEAKDIVFDVETTGVDWKHNDIIGYVVGVSSTPGDVHYIPTNHTGGGNFPGAEAFEADLIRALDRRTNLRIFGHNITFDANMSYKRGVYLGRRLFCTMNTQALLDEHTVGFSLENVARIHGVTPKKSEVMYQHIARTFSVPATKNAMEHFHKLPGTDPMVVEYAEGDGITTFELAMKQIAEVEKQDLWQVVNMENELLWTLVRMEQRGIKVDEERLAGLHKDVSAKVEEAYRGFPDDFNPKSTPSVGKYLKDKGIEGGPVTANGNPSYAEAYLKTFPEGRDILNLRKWKNLNSTFIQPLIENHLFKGRVHPQLNPNRSDQYGTISGRLSCSNPNLQQVPKRDKERAKLFRTVFVPDEGFTMFEDDWSQCEPRLFAHYSRDPELLAGYNADPPRDVHTIVSDMLGVDRQFGKTLNMGLFNGMGAPALSGHLDVSLNRAKELLDGWNSLFPSIGKFRNRAADVFSQRGYVRTLLGRKCRLDNPRFAHKAVSRIIQGGNADIMKYKLVELDKFYEYVGNTIQLLSTIHDAALGQFNDEVPSFALETARDIMVDVNGPPFNLSLPFAVDRSFGATWSEASFGGAG